MQYKQYIYNELDNLNIMYEVLNHKAIFSEKDTDISIFDSEIVIGKNLFLRNDKKKNYYLISLPLAKRVDLALLATKLNEKRLSFANENELKEYLSITPGSVSYLNVIVARRDNARYEEVTYIVDKELLKANKIGFHSSDNTATVITTPDSIEKVYKEYNLKYNIIEM